ncbi:MAG: family 16 glycoside hydrolase [Acidobacteriota bacterium]
MFRTPTPVAILLVLGVMGAGASSAAQESGQTTASAAGILAQFPATSPGSRDRLAGQMLALGEPGLAEITRQLVPDGAGRDTSARFALNAMAVYASQFGGEHGRAIAERALIVALASSTAAEVRTFLLSQLQIVGREAAVEAAAPLLMDPALVEPATQLMLAVRSESAGAALVAALGSATGPGRVTIVKGIGELKVGQAYERLQAFAKDPNPSMRRAALMALARLANPRSEKTLFDAAERAGFGYDPANATAALLDYAQNLAERDPKTAERLCRQVMKKTDRAGRLPTRAAALVILVETRGTDALPDLLKAVDHADRAFRQAALQAAEPLAGVAALQRWIAKARSVNPERRAEIIAMLGRQGDRRALPFLRASLAAREPEVMVAAANALACIEEAEAAPDLLARLRTAPDEAALKIADVLLWIVDEPHLGPLVEMLDELPPATKVAAIGVVGARNGKRFADRILPLTSDRDPAIRAAAFGALAGVARAADVPVLLGLLDSADDELVPLVQKAIVEAVSQSAPGTARVRLLAQALATSAHPERILEAMPQIGGTDALATTAGQLDSAADDVRAAAFRALTRWPGTEATGRLLSLFASGHETYRNQAFSAYVRQISTSSLPADQKLLRLRQILVLSSTVGDRRILIRALERIRTFKSFLLVASFLDDGEVAGEAAGALMRIALPTSAGAGDGLTGTIVRDGLSKALPLLTGPQRDADQERVREYLAAMPAGEGFVPLFNGVDVTGWQGLVENSIARARLTPEELAAKQTAADERMRANWSVRDGSIVFNGAGDNLCTVKEYGDFEMIVDWRITKGGDSGIYLRGTPQVQIWDPARTDVGAQVGSGGLYNNQRNPSKPLVFADNPVGEWNTFRITMVGDKVTVFLNGVLVADRVTMENYWDRKQPIFPRGAIELQAHGTDLAFRDIYVRELGPEGYNLTEEERAEGFVALFNGRDLDGWVGNTTGYTVADGAIAFDPKAGDRSNLYTAREYADFQFRFEFQLTPGANSGVGIRAPREGDAAYVGMEIQVLDDDAPRYAALQPYQYHGSVYGIIPAKRGSLRPAGEWNSQEILVRGTRIRVTLNGAVIVDGDLAEATRNGTLDHRPHPGLERASGHIGWLSHDSVARFRNIRIRDLSPDRARR